MKLYLFLSSVKFLSKSYAAKFLFIAFLGIHIPLIGLVLYIGFSNPDSMNTAELLMITLLLTLAATALTLYLLNRLLLPVTLAKKALDNYIQLQEIPDLPMNNADEVGILLRCIQQNIRSLEEANRIKTDLLHALTHDLRSPLTAIISLTHLMHPADAQEQQKLIKLIQQNAEQELEFIANYIAMIETANYSDHKTVRIKANLLELAQTVAGRLNLQLKEKRINLQMDISPLLHITTPDPLIFERVIQNLLSNAIKFSHFNSSIRFQAKEDSGKIKLTFADNGVGFNQQDAHLLFKKFTPLKRAGTLNEATTGIGLYLTAEIVNMHHGKIWATSNGPDSGSQFHIELPA